MSQEKVLMKGNEAMAEAAIRAGCRFFFGYPITPQTEVAAYMAKRMPKEGGTYLQAESEIAAINMVYGASVGGRARHDVVLLAGRVASRARASRTWRAPTFPAVIVNVQRGGPGLGGIQPSQSDYWQATRAMGHGDFQVLVFAPSTVQEMADLAYLAFEKADEYRMPAMILSDGMLGQMMEPVVLPERVEQLPEKPWATTGHQGKRKHNIVDSLYLTADELERLNIERFERYETVKAREQRAETFMCEDAEIVLVSFGATARIAHAAPSYAPATRASRRAFCVPSRSGRSPWTPSKAAWACAKAFLSVEMNMGQMVDDVRLAVNGRVPVEFFGRTGGIIPTPDEVLGTIRKLAGKGGE